MVCPPAGPTCCPGDQSTQTHTQEECEVVQPVTKQAKIAHRELRGCMLPPVFCCHQEWVLCLIFFNFFLIFSNFCHLVAIPYSPLIQSFFPTTFFLAVLLKTSLCTLSPVTISHTLNVSPGSFGHPTSCQGSGGKSAGKGSLALGKETYSMCA